MIDIFYYLTKPFIWFLSNILPVELINRLFWIMPGRLVIDILRWKGAKIGKNTKIMPPILFHNFQDKSSKPFQNLAIGDNCFLGRDCFIDLIGKINIEDNVTLAMGVMLITHLNVGNSYVKYQYPTVVENIIIRQGAYIGARATIIAPVEIGLGSLIGAGSLVLADIPPCSIGVGVPAKKIRNINEK